MSKAPYVTVPPALHSQLILPFLVVNLERSTGSNRFFFDREPARRVFTEHGREYGFYDYIFPVDQARLTAFPIESLSAHD